MTLTCQVIGAEPCEPIRVLQIKTWENAAEFVPACCFETADGMSYILEGYYDIEKGEYIPAVIRSGEMWNTVLYAEYREPPAEQDTLERFKTTYELRLENQNKVKQLLAAYSYDEVSFNVQSLLPDVISNALCYAMEYTKEDLIVDALTLDQEKAASDAVNLSAHITDRNGNSIRIIAQMATSFPAMELQQVWVEETCIFRNAPVDHALRYLTEDIDQYVCRQAQNERVLQQAGFPEHWTDELLFACRMIDKQSKMCILECADAYKPYGDDSLPVSQIRVKTVFGKEYFIFVETLKNGDLFLDRITADSPDGEIIHERARLVY